MQIVITAKAGFTKGASWLLQTDPLVIGRSYRCDIVVNDGTVSRQHCRIHRVPEGVRLEDLGSRNPALVDGVPQEDIVLKAGDEFSVGRAIFIVTAVATPITLPERRPSDSDTLSLDLKDLGLDSCDQGGAWPGSMADYVLLFHFTRACGTLRSEAAVCGQLEDVLNKRVDEPRVAILQEQDGHWPVESFLGALADKVVPQENIDQAVDEHRAFSFSTSPADGLPSDAFLAPIFFAGQCEGVALLTGRVKRDESDRESALRLFSALCELAGPHVRMVRDHERLVRLNHRLTSTDGFEKIPLIGRSRIMKGLRTQIYEAAQTPLNVLITGETGTGKEVIARAIHRNSARVNKPYIIINCAAIPAELFESELFGYERGAFTGAHGTKKGLLSFANGGILFLDEVGDLSAENQARILRVLEQGAFRRIGAGSEEHVDVRFVAATNRPVDDKAFRSDLYHRLAGFTLQAPPLRERAEDIPLLAQYFMDTLAAGNSELIHTLSPEAETVLRQYHWPGNVRQLRNTIERIAHRTLDSLITAEDIWRDGLIPKDREHDAGPLLTLAEMERKHVLQVLRTCGGNRAKAARLLGISRSTLYLKLGEYGVEN